MLKLLFVVEYVYIKLKSSLLDVTIYYLVKIIVSYQDVKIS
jgi:hypothetical protein